MTDLALWGPLAPLIGEWEGNEGIDVSYSNEKDAVIETPFRERTSMKPFGPVTNGTQCLYGLDYRMAAWRADEENPFHTEVGYWLWDAAERTVMRCFVIPRGSAVLVGGVADPDAREFTMTAEHGSEIFGILSNPFLARAARSRSYEVTVTVDADGSWSYGETTMIEHARVPGTLAHTDRNRLRRAVG